VLAAIPHARVIGEVVERSVDGPAVLGLDSSPAFAGQE
jgi:hypothetical protein